MAYIEEDKIFLETNGGLDIILTYYPQANDVVSKQAKNFKIRGNEKTASATLKQLQNGVWVVTDFGGDQKSRNAIHICALEENITYGEAIQLLGAKYNIEGAVMRFVKPIIEKRPLYTDEVPGTYGFEFREFEDEDLKIFGPRVNESYLDKFKLKAISSFKHIKDNEVIITTATDEYPIYAFDYGTWQKIYQPKAEKQYRFRYAGEKPNRFCFGLEQLAEAFKQNKIKVENEEEDFYEEEEENPKPKKKKDPRLDRVFIMSGGSDGINMTSFNEHVIWFNSESEQLDWAEYKRLKEYVKEIFYVGDLDLTGRKQALAIGLKFLDIKLFYLPSNLSSYRDKRGNPCKDFKDWVEKFYKEKEENIFIGMFKKIIENSYPLQFWTESYDSKGKRNFTISNTKLYNFLEHMGFGKYTDPNNSEDFIYIQKVGNIIKQVRPIEIESFVHDFLAERQMSTELRDYVYNSPRVKKDSLTRLQVLDVDFVSAGRDFQYFFFHNKIWKITPDDIIEMKQGEIDNYVWYDKIIDFRPKLAEKQFEITTDASGNMDIKIHEKNNPLFNFLINSSRIHWKKELEDNFRGKTEEAAKKYHEANRFNIAGEGLTAEEIYEQKLHLINKMYSIGYLLHQYKIESKAWCVFAMDNKVSDDGGSHGGSGKSLCYGYLNNILKRRFFIKGRDSKITSNDFIYHGITEDTDYVFIDDANQYLDFGFFFSEITGSLKVNPKNGQPFEIPFNKSPKFVITSNYTLRDIDPSTARRILYTVFSDYYHANHGDEYKQERTVSSDFEGRNLYRDFTNEEWNLYYNFCAQCLQFFLKWPTKGNVELRNLRSEIGEVFEGWAEGFFMQKEVSPGDFNTEIYKNLDTYIVRHEMFDCFQKETKNTKWSATKFKKSLRAFCKLKGWILNPDDLCNQDKKIVQTIAGKSQEVFYIKTEPVVSVNLDVKSYDNESDIFTT
nr:hypothetical protein [uncultured Flavobacterium sp.]